MTAPARPPKYAHLYLGNPAKDPAHAREDRMSEPASRVKNVLSNMNMFFYFCLASVLVAGCAAGTYSSVQEPRLNLTQKRIQHAILAPFDGPLEALFVDKQQTVGTPCRRDTFCFETKEQRTFPPIFQAIAGYRFSLTRADLSNIRQSIVKSLGNERIVVSDVQSLGGALPQGDALVVEIRFDAAYSVMYYDKFACILSGRLVLKRAQGTVLASREFFIGEETFTSAFGTMGGAKDNAIVELLKIIAESLNSI